MNSNNEEGREKGERRPSRDIPGFYFDPERNRYFPIKKRGPGGTDSGPGPPPPIHEEDKQEVGDRGDSSMEVGGGCNSTTFMHCHGDCGCGHAPGSFQAENAYHNHWEKEKRVAVRPSVKGLVTMREVVGGRSSWRGCADGPRSFQRRIMEATAERPLVWDEGGELRCSTCALVDVPLVVGSNKGEWRGSGLLIGGPYGELRCIGVSATEASDGDAGSCNNDDCFGEDSCKKVVGGPPLQASRSLFRWTFGSSITALRRWWVTSPVEQQRVIGSSMGCGDVPARLFVIQVDAAYQPCPDMQVIMGLYVYQFAKQTLWTVEASPNGSDVAIGTSNSAEIFNVDTKSRTSIIKNSSAVLSQQFTNDGQVLLCGLRNGVISTVDRRQAPPASPRSDGHWGSLGFEPVASMPAWQARGSNPTGGKSGQGSSQHRHWERERGRERERERGRERERERGREREREREWDIRGKDGAGWSSGRGRPIMDRTSGQFRNDMKRQRYGDSKRVRMPENELYSSHTPVMRMGSSVCSLKVLRSCDHYVLASAMNGSISQWDRRMVKKPVREFEGHVNSHTMLQLDVDPTETMLVSGSEDKTVRIWSLTSGKPLHVAKGFSAPVVTLSWAALRDKGTDVRWGHGEQWQGTAVGKANLWGLWMGSSDGVSYMGAGESSRCRCQWERLGTEKSVLGAP